VDLESNRITEVRRSAELWAAGDIRHCNISNNDIAEIPLVFGRCRRLKALLIAGNPQRAVRATVIAKGTEAIIQVRVYGHIGIPIYYDLFIYLLS